MTSVARKAHIPSNELSCCCATSSKWCSRNGSPSVVGGASISVVLIAGLRLLRRVGIRADGHDRGHLEVLRRRRRLRLPLQSGGAPRVRARGGRVSQRQEQVDERQDVADGQDRGAGG